jgi:phosphoribosyl-AMP cyclohydrolase
MDFGKRISIEAVEEGNEFMPKFDDRGLIPVITMEESSNLVLMHGYLNKEALKLSIETKQAHYWSRSREQLWKKAKQAAYIKISKKFLLMMTKIA